MDATMISTRDVSDVRAFCAHDGFPGPLEVYGEALDGALSPVARPRDLDSRSLAAHASSGAMSKGCRSSDPPGMSRHLPKRVLE